MPISLLYAVISSLGLPTIEIANSVDIVLMKTWVRFVSAVEGRHDGVPLVGMSQTKRMSDLMHRHLEQINTWSHTTYIMVSHLHSVLCHRWLGDKKASVSGVLKTDYWFYDLALAWLESDVFQFTPPPSHFAAFKPGMVWRSGIGLPRSWIRLTSVHVCVTSYTKHKSNDWLLGTLEEERYLLHQVKKHNWAAAVGIYSAQYRVRRNRDNSGMQKRNRSKCSQQVGESRTSVVGLGERSTMWQGSL